MGCTAPRCAQGLLNCLERAPGQLQSVVMLFHIGGRTPRISDIWPRGPMDKASAYGAGDCRFESCRGHFVHVTLSRCLLSSEHSWWRRNAGE